MLIVISTAGHTALRIYANKLFAEVKASRGLDPTMYDRKSINLFNDFFLDELMLGFSEIRKIELQLK